MAALCAKVEALDAEDRTIETDYAYGNTQAAVNAAAGALRRQMENAYEETHPGVNVIIGRTVKA